MVKVEVSGIISIDPSYRGMGIMIYIYNENNFNIYSDDCDILELSGVTMKQIKTTASLAMCINKWVLYITQKFPIILKCSCLIVENQFCTNMKKLSNCVINQLLMIMNINSRFKTMICELSALKVKRVLGVEYGGTHNDNKKKAVEYVKNNSNDLIGSDHVESHNIADACLLLNAFIRVKKSIYFVMEGERYKCPGCKGTAFLYTINKEGSRYKPGTRFIGCKSTQFEDGKWVACEKKYSFVVESNKKLFDSFKASEPDVKEPETTDEIGLKRSSFIPGISEPEPKKTKTHDDNERLISRLDEIRDICVRTFELLGYNTNFIEGIKLGEYDGAPA